MMLSKYPKQKTDNIHFLFFSVSTWLQTLANVLEPLIAQRENYYNTEAVLFVCISSLNVCKSDHLRG